MIHHGFFGTDIDTDQVRNDVVRAISQTKVPESNISQNERKALNGLKKDRSIKVLPADKGTAMVVMDTKDYDAKCLTILSDTDTYEVLKNDPTSSLQRQLIDKLKSLKKSGNLTHQEYTKMRPSGDKSPPPKFYGLPKIHKTGAPLRPINSACGSLFYGTAKEMARILGPLVGKNGYSVNNTKDFVDRQQSRNIADDETQVSFDVSNLFGNVDIDKALTGVRKRLEKDNTLHSRTNLTVDQIMDLLEFCLKNSYFVFHNTFYRQKFGAAMGSPISPIIANLFMEDFESRAISTAPTPPKCWDRYVDDTYSIVKKDKVDELHAHINSIEPSIKFTREPPQPDGSVPFLDTRSVPQEDGSIRTIVYRKPTHTDLYVQWDSNHPLSAKLSVVSSLFHRANVVCRNENDLKSEQDYLSKVLEYNGYPKWAINKGKQRLEKLKTITSSTDNRDNTVKRNSYVVMDYVKGLSERIRDIFKRKGTQVYFKGSNTLRNILVSPKDKDPKGSKQDVIYHIPCSYPSCNACYIGETGRTLVERLRDHVSDNNSAVKRHHLDTGHPLPNEQDIKIVNVESNAFRRKVKEAIFIKVNNPSLNQNIGKFNLPPIYDQLLEGGAGGKLLIAKTVKEAIPKIKIRKPENSSQYQIVRD